MDNIDNSWDKIKCKEVIIFINIKQNKRTLYNYYILVGYPIYFYEVRVLWFN